MKLLSPKKTSKYSRFLLSIIFLLLVISLIEFWLLFYKGQVPLKDKNISFPEIEKIKDNASFSDLKTFFTKLAEEKGAPYAYKVLAVAPIPPNTDMHLLGHVVGDVLYKQQGVKGISVCTQNFRNACSHTIVVGLFMDKGETALSEIIDACRQAPGGIGAYGLCFHGLGHGILAYTDYDLRKAIEICEKTGDIKNHNREPVECISGTVMEIIGGGFHDRRLWEEQSKKYLTSDNPLSPCDSGFMPDVARSQCYVYLTPRLFKLAGANLARPTPEDFKKAFPLCNQISNTTNRNSCYGGFGKEFVVLAKGRDIRNIEQMSDIELGKIYEWCMLADTKEGGIACILYATNSIFWGGENKPNVAIKFCSLIKEKDTNQVCFSNLIGAFGFYIKDKDYREKFCKELPNLYHEECRKKLIES